LKELRFATNDPGQPELYLTLKGRVARYVEVEPQGVRIEGRVGERITRQVHIRPHRDHPFAITGVKGPATGDIRLDLTPVTQPGSGQGYLLRATCIKKSPGLIMGYIQLTTDSEKVPLIRIPVRGRVLAAGAASGTQ
jgi:hypothetical protein